MFGLICQLFVHCLISLARIKPLVVFGLQGEVDTCSYILGPVMELTQWVKRDWHRQRADQLTITVTVTELQLQLHSYRPVTYHTADHIHITQAHALTNTHTQKCPLNTTMHAFPRTTHVATHTHQYHKTVVLSHRQSTHC